MSVNGAYVSAFAKKEKPLRILVVAHSATLYGGAEKVLYELLKQLHARYGTEITILVPQAGGTLTDAAAQEHFRCAVAHYYRHCYSSPRVNFVEEAKVRVKKILDYKTAMLLAGKLKGQFDVVYTNTRVIFLGVYLARILKIPHIWHIHEFAEEFGVRFALDHNRRMGRMADRFITTSKAVANSLPPSVDRRKVRVVYNGVLFHQNVEPEAHEGLNLLVCGTVQPGKRQLDAVRALHLMKSEGHSGIRLNIVGNVVCGCEAYLEEIRRFIQENALQDSVIFHGYQENMPLIRAQMDVELLCSDAEGFGLVTVEGMRAGLVVVAANCGATPEIITHGVDGLLYEPKNIQDLKEKILMALQKTTRAELGENAKKSVRDRFLLQQSADEVMQVLGELAGGRGI